MICGVRRHGFYFALFLALSGCGLSKSVNGQTDNSIYTQDVLHFWEAYDSLQTGVDTINVFQKIVLDRATESFKEFIKRNNITAKNYAAQIRRYPKFYRSIRANSLKLIQSETEIKSLVQKLRDIYPNLVYADFCIAFGNFYTGGTVSVNSKTRIVYIGLEYHGLDSSTVVSEFNETMKDYLSRSNFFRTVIHELVHVQQTTHGRKVSKAYYGGDLVNSILREGVPDFIAKLIVPNGNDGRYIGYGVLHERKLKNELKSELWQSDRSKWIYNSKKEDGRPSDLGYFMGSKIANAFYEKYKSSPDVIKLIIEIEDAKEFVSKSGYFSD